MWAIDADDLKKKAILLTGENDSVYAVPEEEIDNVPTIVITERIPIVLEQKKMERLYGMLQSLEKRGEEDAAAALRWAIFTLENAK